MEYFLVTILAAWFLVSALAQVAAAETAPDWVKSASGWFQSLDTFSLIPSWNFFAPNPGTTDYHLFYRDKLESDELSVWREIPIEKEPSLLKAIWNPHKRKSKVLSDVVSIVNQSLGQSRNRALKAARKEREEGKLSIPDPPVNDANGEPEDPEFDRAKEIFQNEIRFLKVTIPYLIILNYLSHIPHPVFSASTQFLLAETRTYDPSMEPRVVYISEFHKLP